jgi:hypothetical protein
VNTHIRRLGRGSTVALAFASLASVASGACATRKPLGFEGFNDDAGAADPLLQPNFGPTKTSSVEPPAMSGGTLLVTKGGAFAVAADPDRDAVYVVDLASNTSRTISLQAGDEPGRLAEDGAGHVHVALRRGGALVTVDPQTAGIVDRRSVCPAPRGLAWEAATDLVWVACATGELVAMPAAGGGAARQFVLDRDLRDVVMTSDGIAVSQFRSAEVLHVDATGFVSRVDASPSATQGFTSHVMWRAAAGPSGTIYTVHQEESLSSLSTGALGGVSDPSAPSGGSQGGYGISTDNGCSIGAFGASSTGGFAGPPPPQFFAGSSASSSGGGFPVSSSSSSGAPGGDAADDAVAVADDAGVEAAVFTIPPDDAGAGPVPPPQCMIDSLPVGGSIGPVGDAGIIIPGPCAVSGAVHSVLTAMDRNGRVIENQVLVGVLPVDLAVSPDGSTLAVAMPGNAFVDNMPTILELTPSPCGSLVKSSFTLNAAGNTAQPVAVAFDGAGRLLVQTREPAQLWTIDGSGSQSSLTLSGISRHDTGYDVFHTQAGGMIACASCHPEGRDDGHVWTLDGNQRRTPSLAGTIAGTAPYHWPGDMKDMTALVDNVYTVRMSGAALARDQMQAVTRWVQGRPAPPAPSWVDSAASARGKVLFDSAAVGCSACHSGPKFTDNSTRDVGSGGAFQVPPLVGVGWRTPLLHDGCARTIADRFGHCESPTHGKTESLTSDQLSDLGMYLEGL